MRQFFILLTVFLLTAVCSGFGQPVDSMFYQKHDFAPGDAPMSLIAEDLDDDLDIDIAVAHLTDTVRVYHNNGDGTFTEPQIYVAGDACISMYAANLNNDSFLDLAVANNGSDNLSVFINNGDGTFADPVHYDVGEEP